MAHVTSHPAGNFCWLELGTTDSAAAKKFYSGLFGWGINDIPMGPDGVYTMFQIGGKDIAAMYNLNAEQSKMGIPPHWGTYVAVKNVDEAAKKAKSLGAQVLMEPFDVFTAGRMTQIQDPTGAVIGLWQAKDHIGSSIVNEANTFCWNDLATKDEAAASKFYTALFGWSYEATPGTNPVYSYIINNGTGIGGMLTLQKEWGDAPSHWMPYFNVKDCDATVNKAVSSGGIVCVPPTDIPTVGRFAVIQDPQGAMFSIIYLSRI